MGENKRNRDKRNRRRASVPSKRSVTLAVGDTVSLKLKNKPPKVRLTWKTDETACVSVSRTGKLRALKKGMACPLTDLRFSPAEWRKNEK